LLKLFAVGFCRLTVISLLHALIVGKVDYCNSLLARMYVQLHNQLQSVLNAAARLIFRATRTDHISPLLRDVHWLCVPERVKFKLCLLAYRCLHDTAPPYLADDLCLMSADGNRRHLSSADSPTLVVRPTRCSATVHFLWQLDVLGTVFHQPSGMRHHFCRSGAA